MSYKVAGVSFENRQDLLKRIYDKQGPFIECLLNKTLYEGEPAIECIETTSRMQIGWIAKKNIPELYNLPCQRIFGEIGFFKGTWFCELRSPVIFKSPIPF